MSGGKKADPTVQPIIVKKVYSAPHSAHHGGAWKVAYADFVTAMMAFFLLMWLLGATDEKERKALADYFSPTLVEMRQNSAGSNGVFGGDSIVSADNYAHRASQAGNRSITIPRDSSGGSKMGAGAANEIDRERFKAVKKAIEDHLSRNDQTRRLAKNVRFTETREGLRIELVDEADFSMFALGTDMLLPQARALLGEVAVVIAQTPNPLMVRGHTDALRFRAKGAANNWTLSASRAEATRAMLQLNGVSASQFFRIEGVAEREPYVPADPYDPRNRRISITLGWKSGGSQDGRVEVAAHDALSPTLSKN